MCAVGGILRFGPAHPADKGHLGAMGEALAHRSPDGRGTYAQGPLVLLHGLMRLHSRKTQAGPYESEDGRWVLSFNGEIYNHAELRNKWGLPDRHATDAEVLLEGWARRGEAILPELNGMFAFALWDKRERKLTLGRDRLGEKPLYYYQNADRFVFASEVRGLAAAGVPLALHHDALAGYLAYRYVTGGETLFRGIKKLPPGHTLAADGHSPPRPYWTLRSETQRPVGREEFSALLEDAHRIRTPSIWEPAVFLSAGIDSAAVASYLPKGSAAFTFSSPHSAAEAPAAAALCARWGLAHEEVFVPAPLSEIVNAAIGATEEPIGDSIVVPTWSLAAAAHGRTRTVLSGEGADELFGGYAHHFAFHRALRCRQTLGNRGLGAAIRIADRLPTALLDAVGPYSAALGSDGRDRFVDLLRQVKTNGALGHSVTSLFPPGDCARSRAEKNVRSLPELLRLDLQSWLPDYTLLRMDKILMRFGLEGRYPFLDHRVVEMAMRLTPAQLIRGRRRKLFLRHSLRARLGALARKKKTTFQFDLSRGDAGFFSECRDLSAEWQRRGLIPPAAKESAFLTQKKLFSLYVLDRWMKEFNLSF